MLLIIHASFDKHKHYFEAFILLPSCQKVAPFIPQRLQRIATIALLRLGYVHWCSLNLWHHFVGSKYIFFILFIIYKNSGYCNPLLLVMFIRQLQACGRVLLPYNLLGVHRSLLRIL